jgi:hypothetical protein
MEKFKEGDIVVGTPEANVHYSITREGWKGKVLEIDNTKMTVRGVDKDGPRGAHIVNTKHFELYGKITPKKLASLKVGSKIELVEANQETIDAGLQTKKSYTISEIDGNFIKIKEDEYGFNFPLDLFGV